MADNAKIGHRNYAIVNVETLTAEELEAVKKALNFEGYTGIVPYKFEINKIKSEIYYLRVFKCDGFTIVLDGDRQVRFIYKGYLTCDQVSLMNKGNICEFIRKWYLGIIAQEKQNENPWNLL